MATCPRCLGALTENHRCPKGRFSRVGEALLTLGVGSFAGAVLCYAIDSQPAGALVLSSADKELVGQNAASIRALRPPEPYGGKGIRYRAEQIRRKAGKAAKGKGN